MSRPKKAVTAAEVIRARRIALNTRAGYVSLIGRIAGLVIAVYVIFTQVFLITQNHGLGMFPAMKDGDLVIAYRLQQEYAKNDVVVYTVDGVRKVGRIAARGTDIVIINENGSLMVNGIIQSGEILYPTYPKDIVMYPYHVPEGHIFILGDYRTNTEDSRDYGSIPMENVEGKVISILRRRGL